MVRVVDNELSSTTFCCSCDYGIHFVGEQSSPLLVFRTAFDDLFPRDDATGTFKVCGEKQFHCSTLPQRESRAPHPGSHAIIPNCGPDDTRCSSAGSHSAQALHVVRVQD